MALAIDASTPAVQTISNGIGTTTTTSSAFSPPAGAVIFAFFAIISDSAQDPTTVTGVTDSLGSHLSWSLYTGSRDNISSGATLAGSTEVWWAYTASAQTSMTLTATYAHDNHGASTGTVGGLLQIVVFTGASSTQNSAATTRNSTSPGTPSQTLTTTVANSWVFGIVQDWSGSTLPTVGSGQTTTINGSASQGQNTADGDAFWVQLQNATTATPGTVVTINDTAPTSIVHHFSMVEVLPQTLATPPMPWFGFYDSGLGDNLLARYDFTGNTNDTSGNGNNGTINGGVTATTDRHSTASAAYSFNGSTGYIDIPNSGSINPTGSMSVNAWINANNLTAVAGIISKDISGSISNPPYFLQVAGSGTTVAFGTTSAANAAVSTTSGSLSTGQWYMITGTFDGSTMKLYVNSTFVMSAAQTDIGSTTGSLKIGQQKAGFSRFFNGAIDDVRLYSVALTPSQIASLYTQ